MKINLFSKRVRQLEAMLSQTLNDKARWHSMYQKEKIKYAKACSQRDKLRNEYAKACSQRDKLRNELDKMLRAYPNGTLAES